MKYTEMTISRLVYELKDECNPDEYKTIKDEIYARLSKIPKSSVDLLIQNDVEVFEKRGENIHDYLISPAPSLEKLIEIFISDLQQTKGLLLSEKAFLTKRIDHLDYLGDLLESELYNIGIRLYEKDGNIDDLQTARKLLTKEILSPRQEESEEDLFTKELNGTFNPSSSAYDEMMRQKPEFFDEYFARTNNVTLKFILRHPINVTRVKTLENIPLFTDLQIVQKIYSRKILNGEYKRLELQRKHLLNQAVDGESYIDYSRILGKEKQK